MKSKLPFESLYVYAVTALLGYVVADLTILSIRDQMIPTKAPPAARQKFKQTQANADRGAYTVITSKNAFNSDGLIPPALGPAAPAGQPQKDLPPVLSQLPLNLIGTLVHVDASRSIASINMKGKQDDLALSPDDEIEGLAKIVKVERNKVILRNLSTQRLEYIEIKSDSKLLTRAKAVQNGEVTQETPNDFSIKRDDVERLTSNLPELLQQARAVPHLVNGRVEGFQVLDLQAGSIYDKLGIKRMDVIKAVNGEPVDSPSKAMELYQALKTSSSISIQVERNGQKEMLNYQIH